VSKTNQQVDRYRVGNGQAAEIILANAVRYGGEASLMVRWARTVVADSAGRAA
jgi:hypothetical protein